MKSTQIKCLCGATVLKLSGVPVAQAYCHCDDCQAAHGAAYIGTVVYPSHAVEILEGTLLPLVIKTAPRMHCASCPTIMFTEVESVNLRSVNAALLPKSQFEPEYHLQCQHAVLPVVDGLPHYKGFPAAFGGSEEYVSW